MPFLISSFPPDREKDELSELDETFPRSGDYFARLLKIVAMAISEWGEIPGVNGDGMSAQLSGMNPWEENSDFITEWFPICLLIGQTFKDSFFFYAESLALNTKLQLREYRLSSPRTDGAVNKGSLRSNCTTYAHLTVVVFMNLDSFSDTERFFVQIFHSFFSKKSDSCTCN